MTKPSRWQELCRGRDPLPGECAVYVLKDRETETPFYVGSTTGPLAKRLMQHRHPAMVPVLEVVEYVHEEHRFTVEADVFDRLQAKGYPLRNRVRPRGGGGALNAQC